MVALFSMRRLVVGLVVVMTLPNFGLTQRQVHGNAPDPIALGGHSSAVYALAFSPNGEQLAALARGELTLWNVDKIHAGSRPIARIAVPDNTSFEPNVYSAPISYSPDGKRIALPVAKPNPPTVFNTNGVQVWDISKPERAIVQASAAGEENTPGSNGYFAFSPDGEHLALAINATIQLWNPESGKFRTLSPEPIVDADTQFIRYSPDGTRLATMRKDGLVKLWDAKTDRQIRTVNIFTSIYKITRRHARSGSVGVDMGAVSPDLKRAAVIDRAATEGIALWDIEKGKRSRDVITLRDPKESIAKVRWSQDGMRLAYLMFTIRGPQIGIYDLSKKKEKTRIESKQRLGNALALSPDFRSVAVSVPESNSVHLWTLTDRTEDEESQAESKKRDAAK
jgi:WD40 repeat protein